MMFLTLTPSNSENVADSYMFVIGKDVEAAQPYRMIGSPMRFASLRDAVEAAAFCGYTVYPDGQVMFLPDLEPQSSLFLRDDA